MTSMFVLRMATKSRPRCILNVLHVVDVVHACSLKRPINKDYVILLNRNCYYI